MNLEATFEEAVSRSKSLPRQPNEVLLELYALYKQATVGDVGGSRPGPFDMVGRAKYDAWSALEGTTREDAKRRYAERVDELANP